MRPGAAEAYVEGVFTVPERIREEISRRLPDSVHVDGEHEELIVARRVSADGRTRAYLNGRTVTVGDLRELGARLISFYGQHEHRKLTWQAPSSRCSTRCAATDHAPDGSTHARRSYRQIRDLEAELERLAELEQARERELDLLEHELAEIEAVAPEEHEYQELLARRERLSSLDALQAAAGAARRCARARSSEQPVAHSCLRRPPPSWRPSMASIPSSTLSPRAARRSHRGRGLSRSALRGYCENGSERGRRPRQRRRPARRARASDAQARRQHLLGARIRRARERPARAAAWCGGGLSEPRGTALARPSADKLDGHVRTLRPARKSARHATRRRGARQLGRSRWRTSVRDRC